MAFAFDARDLRANKFATGSQISIVQRFTHRSGIANMTGASELYRAFDVRRDIRRDLCHLRWRNPGRIDAELFNSGNLAARVDNGRSSFDQHEVAMHFKQVRCACVLQ